MLGTVSKKNGIVAGLALITATVIGLFPPWTEHISVSARVFSDRPAGYSFIASPPAPRPSDDGLQSVVLDWPRLTIEWLTVAFFTAGFILIFRRPRPSALEVKTSFDPEQTNL